MAHLPKDSFADADIDPKKSYIHIRRERRRITWTRFHLSREQDWPRWTTVSDLKSDDATFLGPLAGVEGCEKVWLGRQVEDPEKAALIILWESAPAMEMFEVSPLCGEILRDLGCKDDPSLLSFQWDAGFWFGDDLYGRVTRTTLVIPYTGLPEYEAWGLKIGISFNGFMPAGCEALRLSLPRPFGWQAFAWVDTAKQVLALKDMVEQAQPSVVTDGGEQQGVGDQAKAVGYHFLRWNGNDASLKQEDATAKDPKAKKSWEKMLAKTMPPVSFWEQERWDVELAPCYRVEPTCEDEEDEE